ncbi:MAG: hypothetical protein J4F30_01580 [Acidobacteria bacterium]|nr:hypothetical protein [Acidobacteriota bacterium]
MRTDNRAFRKRARAYRLTMWLLERASRHNGSWIDRLSLRLVNRRITPKDPRQDFMRDEIVDADIGFTASELDAYQRGGRELKRSIPGSPLARPGGSSLPPPGPHGEREAAD